MCYYAVPRPTLLISIDIGGRFVWLGTTLNFCPCLAMPSQAPIRLFSLSFFTKETRQNSKTQPFFRQLNKKHDKIAKSKTSFFKKEARKTSKADVAVVVTLASDCGSWEVGQSYWWCMPCGRKEEKGSDFFGSEFTCVQEETAALPRKKNHIRVTEIQFF